VGEIKKIFKIYFEKNNIEYDSTMTKAVAEMIKL